VISQERFDAVKREGFMGEPNDIAKAVVWLCSDDASFIQGHALVVDGGITISRF
jgi:NAD(P)-dependent dehydrogenase (short-subunit alcohol dehydrogenase family)